MVRFESNATKVKQRLNQANRTMLNAIGNAAVSHIKPLTPVDTSALIGSITHSSNDKSVRIGSSLVSEMYPIYVHEGTYKMTGRPYIRDGVMRNLGNLRTVAERNYNP